MESKALPPDYLYKIISTQNWEASQKKDSVVLPAEDRQFIHLSTQEQLDKIISKYWSHVPEFVVLKIKTTALEGDLKYETNPGGATKYYHLYSGAIPLKAVVNSDRREGGEKEGR